MADSYRSSLWAAAYVINAGCSDDGFGYFAAGSCSRAGRRSARPSPTPTRSLTWRQFASP